MKKILIIVLGILILSLTVFYMKVRPDNQALYEKVTSDFKLRSPDSEFVGCTVGEGDPLVAYVHIKFKKPKDEKIYEEVRQYWKTEEGWEYRDEHLLKEQKYK